MSKKTLQLILVFSALLVVFLVIRLQNRSDKEIPFFDVDSVRIGHLEMTAQNETIVLTKIGDQWKLTNPIAWDVNQEQLKMFFSKVLKVKVTRTPMSEKPDNLEKYRLTPDKAVVLKIYDKQSRLIDQVFFGRSLNSNFCYARRKGSNAIYQLRDNIYDNVSASVFLWRSPVIAEVDLPNLSSVEIKYAGNQYKLYQKDNNWFYEDTKEQFQVDPTNMTVTKLFNALTSLQTYQFIDHRWKEVGQYFKKPAAKVILNDKKGKHTELIFAVGKEDYVYLMKDGNQDTLYLMTLDMLNRFTVAAPHFKATLKVQQ